MEAVSTRRIILDNLEATHQLGALLAARARAGTVIFLEGELGAGKTSLAQGLARGLGITSRVGSPTFNLLQQYEGRLPFYHLDLYRLAPGEAEVRGLDEAWEAADGLCAIEWPDRLLDPPRDRLQIQLVMKDDRREAHLMAHGPHASALLAALEADADPRD